MRCKNCGCENDDNLYICQNCGSPLYDDGEPIVDSDNAGTQVFGAVESDMADGTADGTQMSAEEELRRMKEKQAEDKKKQTTAIIIVLVVVLLAVIAGIVFAVVHAKNAKEETTLSTVKVSQTTETTTEEKTTVTTTEKQTSEVSTSEVTTLATYNVSVNVIGNGEVDGENEYSDGDKVTLIANADDGYEFEGWYEGSKKISSDTRYDFTITKDRYLTANFVISESTTEGADTISGEDDG
ncbi:MAG: hypothetical protein E7571_07335 [Ruminococcaceae bacterium]|nr:hypothetical protein [Oscillospiraceae bacterium]